MNRSTKQYRVTRIAPEGETVKYISGKIDAKSHYLMHTGGAFAREERGVTVILELISYHPVSFRPTAILEKVWMSDHALPPLPDYLCDGKATVTLHFTDAKGRGFKAGNFRDFSAAMRYARCNSEVGNWSILRHEDGTTIAQGYKTASALPRIQTAIADMRYVNARRGMK